MMAKNKKRQKILHVMLPLKK